jgi:acyl-CoA thioester hydrolase
MSTGLQHTVRVQLRWRDMDMLGHLNQSVYHELLEEGRAALVTEIVQRVGVQHAHGGFVLAHVDLDHHAEVRKEHREVEVAVRLVHVGTSSLRLEHEIRIPDGTVAASGTTVIVAWDPATRGKRLLSDAERAALSGVSGGPSTGVPERDRVTGR